MLRTALSSASRSAPRACPLLRLSSSALSCSRPAAFSLTSRHAVPVRTFAVTNAFERKDNTSELLDFETARKDPAKWKKQLLYRSRQRGWLELDLIMGTWAEENLDKLDMKSLEEYAHVVASENPDLIKYFVEKMPLSPELADNSIAKQLVEYAQIRKKKWTVETGNQ